MTRRTGSFSKPNRKVRYALQSNRGHFLAQIDTEDTEKFWVSDPNHAYLWRHPDAAITKEKTFDGLQFPGSPRAVEITFVLNRWGSYDWLVGETVRHYGH